MARALKFQITKVEGLYYLCSENKGADQLRGYHEADLHFCFSICKKQVFSRSRSNGFNIKKLVQKNSKQCLIAFLLDVAHMAERSRSLYIMQTCPCNEYSKTGVYRGTHYFLIFALKHRLWVLVTKAVLTCTPIYVLSKNKKKCHIFTSKNIIFSTLRNCFILHGYVFVMKIAPYLIVLFLEGTSKVLFACGREDLLMALPLFALTVKLAN